LETVSGLIENLSLMRLGALAQMSLVDFTQRRKGAKNTKDGGKTASTT